MPAVPGTDLENDRGDGRGTLELDRRLEMREGSLTLLSLGARVELGAIQERSEEVHDARGAVVVGPPARIAGQVDRRGRGPVIAAIAREHLVASRVKPRHAYRVFDRLGAAVGEEDLLGSLEGVIEDQLGRAGPRDVAVLGCDGAQQVGLLP